MGRTCARCAFRPPIWDYKQSKLPRGWTSVPAATFAQAAALTVPVKARQSVVRKNNPRFKQVTITNKNGVRQKVYRLKKRA